MTGRNVPVSGPKDGARCRCGHAKSEHRKFPCGLGCTVAEGDYWADSCTDFRPVVADTTAGSAEDAVRLIAVRYRDPDIARFAINDYRDWVAARSGGAQDDGAALIAAERRRQVEAEGWTPEHDAEHAGEVLATAACCYALPPQMRKYRSVSEPIEGGVGVSTVPTLWPWVPSYWKPKPDDRIRELVKAGALIAAEIDRLRRALAGPDDARQDGAR